MRFSLYAYECWRLRPSIVHWNSTGNSFGAEYALLVIILSVTVVGGVIVTIIFIYKWWQTRRLLRESTDSPRMSDRDYIDHLQSDSDNMYFVDDDDGLISGKKKKRTTESIGIGRKIMNKTDELLGTTPAMWAPLNYANG